MFRCRRTNNGGLNLKTWQDQTSVWDTPTWNTCPTMPQAPNGGFTCPHSSFLIPHYFWAFSYAFGQLPLNSSLAKIQPFLFQPPTLSLLFFLFFTQTNPNFIICPNIFRWSPLYLYWTVKITEKSVRNHWKYSWSRVETRVRTSTCMYVRTSAVSNMEDGDAWFCFHFLFIINWLLRVICFFEVKSFQFATQLSALDLTLAAFLTRSKTVFL